MKNSLLSLRHSLLGCLVIIVVTGITACSEGSITGPIDEEEPTAPDIEPFQELYDQGVDRYLGRFTPTRQTDLGGSRGTLHAFAASPSGAGPMCYTGNEFQMSTRGGTSELMIFLEGGGGCGPGSCNAVHIALPGVPSRGIMDPADPKNPAAAYSMAYVPYCDGSLFTGDARVDSDGDGEDDRFFRGVQNLSASLDVIRDTFPAPSKIILAGNSAGGLGTHFALPLVRKMYPGVAIELINDSGVGIYEPGDIARLTDYWNSENVLPQSCPSCVGADGNLTDYHHYQLTRDELLRVAYLSSRQDSVITRQFDLVSAAEFEEQLLEATGELSQAFPDRFRSLLVSGDAHTFIQRDYARPVGDTTVRDWIGGMLSGAATWVSVID